jgi:hypothetical protein
MRRCMTGSQVSNNFFFNNYLILFFVIVINDRELLSCICIELRIASSSYGHWSVSMNDMGGA